MHFPEATYISLDFLLPMLITEAGYEVIVEPTAVAYDYNEYTDSVLYEKHVRDGESGYMAIARFKRLLLPCSKGAFVFLSHRVMKWLVPFNLLAALLISFFLSKDSYLFLCLSLLQILTYLFFFVYACFRKTSNRLGQTVFSRVLELGFYFLSLQVAWLNGFYLVLSRGLIKREKG